jgi:hypothetical protein
VSRRAQDRDFINLVVPLAVVVQMANGQMAPATDRSPVFFNHFKIGEKVERKFVM